MIKWLKKLALVVPLSLGILGMHGCIHDDFDVPPERDIPVGTVLTVAELRDMFDGTLLHFEDDYSFYAVVTMDDKTGNIYRSAYLEDATAAINLHLQAPGGIYQGDSVRVYLKGTNLSSYQGMLQVENVNADQNIVKKATNVIVEPAPMQIGEIGSEHQSLLVFLEDVQFIKEDVGETFADSENLQALNRTLEDCHGNTIIVRTSGYANFADEPIPAGNGSVVAVVSEHRGDMQLFIRSFQEVRLDGERCEDNDNGDPDPDVVTSIDEDYQGYQNYDDIDANGWIAIAEEGGRKWICRTHQDNHYAQATSFNATDPMNIMWMITPPVDLDASALPVLEFESAQANYSHDGFGVYIATDFDGSDVAAANWEPLPATLAGSGTPDHQWVDSGLLDLSGYNGIVHIAWRYEGSHPEGNTGSFRVNNVKLYDNE